MLQFWKISTNAEPRCSGGLPQVFVIPGFSVSIARATNVGSARRAEIQPRYRIASNR